MGGVKREGLGGGTPKKINKRGELRVYRRKREKGIRDEK